MKLRRTFRILSSLLLLLASTLALPQLSGGRLETMRLLTAETGWASTAHQLFWTADRGHTWKDITPKAANEDTIASVFFLNPSTGWVLFSRYDEPEPRFDLAATTNGGNRWSVRRVTM